MSRSVGVSVECMNETCASLRSSSASVQDLIVELDGLKNQLPSYWEGDDLNLFIEMFTSFEAKLGEMPEVIESIAAWGENLTDNYMQDSLRTSNAIRSIF